MRIETLRKLAGREEIDYQFLLSTLKKYSRPRDKISSWLKSKELIRVKKGLYIFGKNIAEKPYSQEILANLIYGPSAISLTYALAFYSFIPERVSMLTSITPKRHKKFLTPAGNYTYYYLSKEKYAIGIELYTVEPHQSFLIASPEKALCDQLYLIDKKLKLETFEDMENYLFRDLRIDEVQLKKINLKNIRNISQVYQHKKINLLHDFLRKWI